MDNLEIQKAILEKIKENDSIIIVRHIRPDGDCMGTSLGLRDILRASFPNKKIYSVGNDKSEYLRFLGEEDGPLDEEIYKKSLIIAVDTGSIDRISDDNFKLGKEIIKIDHHLPVDQYGSINYVRDDFPAAALIIVEMYDNFKDELVLPESAANFLYTAIVTDTGRFRFRGVGQRVFELTSILFKYDIDLEKLYANLYLKNKESLRLQSYIFSHFKVSEHGVAYMHITKNMMKRFGLSYEDASAMVSSLDSIKGSLMWILFIDQDKKTIRVRLRSRFVEIVEIAQAFRGGGHPTASGATVYNKKEIKELVKMADEKLKEYKENNEGWL